MLIYVDDSAMTHLQLNNLHCAMWKRARCVFSLSLSRLKSKGDNQKKTEMGEKKEHITAHSIHMKLQNNSVFKWIAIVCNSANALTMQ